MIHNDVLNQLQFLAKTAVPPLVEVSQTPLEEPQWVPGQRLTAVVLANQPNGRFQVQVGDQILDMNLPRNTQAGDQVELTYVANQPRLTFVLTRDLAAAAADHASAQTLPAANVKVSESARSLGDLLQKLADAGGGKAVGTAPSQPLLTSSPGDVKQFAATLRNALSQSGLFYESHQAQWVAGDRNLTDLLKEPQGKLSNLIQAQTAPAELGQKNPVAPIFAAEPSQAAQGLRLPVHADAVSLVQQQLQTLDSRQFVWQGPVWQGQPMDWRVEERGAREGGTGDEEMPHWQTSLKLQLPSLGDVHATLAFMPEGGLRINIRAETDTAEMMTDARGQLVRSMEASGLRVLEMLVEPVEKA